MTDTKDAELVTPEIEAAFQRYADALSYRATVGQNITDGRLRAASLEELHEATRALVRLVHNRAVEQAAKECNTSHGGISCSCRNRIRSLLLPDTDD